MNASSNIILQEETYLHSNQEIDDIGILKGQRR